MLFPFIIFFAQLKQIYLIIRFCCVREKYKHGWRKMPKNSIVEVTNYIRVIKGEGENIFEKYILKDNLKAVPMS